MSRKYVLAAGAAALGAAAMGRRAVRPGQMFVIVDISVPDGRWVDNIIYNSTREADQEAAKLLRKGKRVQVIDAVWFPPAEARLRATGMRGQGRRGRKVLMEMKYGLPARGRGTVGPTTRCVPDPTTRSECRRSSLRPSASSRLQ